MIEPWGLKVNARVYTAGVSNIDYSALSEYGAVIWYDADNTMNGASMNPQWQEIIPSLTTLAGSLWEYKANNA